MTVISRNGRDQMNSSAALRMAARVRSDFVILSVGCGLARRRDDNFLIIGIISEYTDTVSVCQGGVTFRNATPWQPGLQRWGSGKGVAHVSFNVIAVQQVQPATQQGVLAVTSWCRNQGQRPLPVLFEPVYSICNFIGSNIFHIR